MDVSLLFYFHGIKGEYKNFIELTGIWLNWKLPLKNIFKISPPQYFVTVESNMGDKYFSKD